MVSEIKNNDRLVHVRESIINGHSLDVRVTRITTAWAYGDGRVQRLA